MSGDAFLGVRAEYQGDDLNLATLDRDPIELLRNWVDLASHEGVLEPNAMCLTTVAESGQPSSRIVLLRKLDQRGLVFFTNYDSRKGSEIEARPNVCACFWWGALERQVRVEGLAERVPSEESDGYFRSRPVASQAASAASPQSRPIDDLADLERRADDLVREYPEGLPRPEHWGGYVIRPSRFEFWQGRPARLHSRVVFVRAADGWTVQRLAP